jgi:hypothetical protein
VYDAQHPRPGDAQASEQLREYLTLVSNEQYQQLIPKNEGDVREYRRVVGTAARVMLDEGVPAGDEIQFDSKVEKLGGPVTLMKGTLGRLKAREEVPFVMLNPESNHGKAVLWIDGKGKSRLFGDDGKPSPPVARLLDAGYAVASADVFLTGEFLEPGKSAELPAVDKRYSGYTFGYNRPVLANRVRDILTAIGAMVDREDVTDLSLIGTGEAGPWVLLAAGLAEGDVKQAIADVNAFRFANVKSTGEPMFLPGALRYGDIGGLTALAAPCALTIAGIREMPPEALQPLKAMYVTSGAKLNLRDERLDPTAAVELLLKSVAGG